MDRALSSFTGRVAGSILMIAGCCIGAGMLGVPILCSVAGFIPSSVMFFLCWLFMMATGLLLLEVNLWFQEEVSISTMVDYTLGPVGRRLSVLLFAYLFYSIMIAYVSGSGNLLSEIAEDFGFDLPRWVGSFLFTALFALMIYYGTSAVDRFNRILVAGLCLSYILLIFLGSSHIETDYLLHRDWWGITLAIPVMIVSFGYHNMIPSLTTYLDHAKRKLVTVVIVGSLIPLLIYLIWGAIILGIVPPDAFRSSIDSGDFATRALKNAARTPAIYVLAEHFAFFAIVSSFITVALSFFDFLADGLHIKKDAWGKFILCLLTLLPPFFCAMIYPNIFLAALRHAGVFGALILFGIFPVLMVWKGRYLMKLNRPRIIPGGKFVLAAVFAAAAAAIVLSLLVNFGLWGLKG